MVIFFKKKCQSAHLPTYAVAQKGDKVTEYS